MLVRISQNIIPTPTAACFNLLNTEPYFKLGRKISFFGDGYQFRDERFGRKIWVIPILGGEFILDRRFGFTDGLMGGNIWFMGRDIDAAFAACEKAIEAVWHTPGCIAPFLADLSEAVRRRVAVTRFRSRALTRSFARLFGRSWGKPVAFQTGSTPFSKSSSMVGTCQRFNKRHNPRSVLRRYPWPCSNLRRELQRKSFSGRISFT